MKIKSDAILSTGFETALPRLAIGYPEDSLAGLRGDADHTVCLKWWESRTRMELRKSGRPTDKVVEEKVF